MFCGLIQEKLQRTLECGCDKAGAQSAHGVSDASYGTHLNSDIFIHSAAIKTTK